MHLAKIIPLLLLAIAIDGFQFLISISLSVVAAFPGTIAGCAAGAYVAGEAGCAVLGLIGSIPVVNGLLAVVTEPIGIAAGFAISICISFTLGSILVLFLQITGVLDKKAALMAYMGETVPGLNILPAWTALVIRCAMQDAKNQLTNTVLTTVAGAGSKLVLPNTRVGNTVQQRTLNDMRTTVEAQPEYTYQKEDAEPSQRVPMQDMRLRPTATPYAKTT
jgi:hypothetical protein